MKFSLYRQTLIGSALMLIASGASASAFQLAEVSTSGLGRAYAGEAAIGDNASAVATNPALMTRFKQTEFSLGGVYIDSKIKLSGPVTVKSVSGLTLEKGSAAQSSIVPGSFVPNFYLVYPVNESFSLGGGINTNFGLKSQFDSNYDAGLFGGRTELTSVNINLSGAYRITNGFSFGAGLDMLYAKAEIERKAGILANLKDNTVVKTYMSELATGLTALGIMPESQIVHLQGNAWGVGWNSGFLYEVNAHNRFGLAYHSPINLDFKDNNAFSRSSKLAGETGVGRLTLKLPAYWEFSGFHQMTDKFAMHYSVKYTQWKRFDELRGVFDNGDVAFQKPEGYRNNTRVALGATYDVNDKLTLRAGIGYDESAANGYDSASIPDTDRTWYSLGATYRFTPDLSVDLGYAHLVGSHLQFKETQSVQGLVKVEADYSSRSRANLYGLNMNYRF